MFGPGVYVAPNKDPNDSGSDGSYITVQPDPYDWVLRRYYWPPVNRWGENIFKSHSVCARGECWQNHEPVLEFWDHDNKAQGDPEDLEHFHFEYVDSAAGTVRIRDYQDYAYWDPGTKKFRIGASPDYATSFQVEFVQHLLFNIEMTTARLMKTKPPKEN